MKLMIAHALRDTETKPTLILPCAPYPPLTCNNNPRKIEKEEGNSIHILLNCAYSISVGEIESTPFILRQWRREGPNMKECEGVLN